MEIAINELCYLLYIELQIHIFIITSHVYIQNHKC